MNILAISPTYNEKKNIAELINRITLIPTEIDLLIIDDFFILDETKYGFFVHGCKFLQ